MRLTPPQLDRLRALAMRSHDGAVEIREVERDSLPWIEVAVLLTDMGDVPPLHVFHVDPRGRTRKPA